MHCALMSLELKASHGVDNLWIFLCHSSVWSAEVQHQKNPHGNQSRLTGTVLIFVVEAHWVSLKFICRVSGIEKKGGWLWRSGRVVNISWRSFIRCSIHIPIVFRDILQIRTSTGSSSSFFSSGAVDPPWCGRLEVPLLAQDGPHPFLSRTDALLLHLHIYIWPSYSHCCWFIAC